MKQTNVNKSLKKIVFAFAIFLIPFSSSAQNADTYKAFINKTGFAILEVRKAIMAGDVSDLDQNLANLVQLQKKAIELFAKKDYAMAAYTSSFGREEAIKLLIKLRGEANKYYTVSDDEKNLFASVSSQADIDRLAKQTLSTLSSSETRRLDPNSIVKNVTIE